MRHEDALAVATATLDEDRSVVGTLELGDLVRLAADRPYRFDHSAFGIFSRATRVEYRDRRDRGGYLVVVTDARGLSTWCVGEESGRARTTWSASELRSVLGLLPPLGAPNADVARTYDLLGHLPSGVARALSDHADSVSDGNPLRGLYYPELAAAVEVEGGLRLLADLADGAPVEWLLRHLRSER